VVKSPKVTGGGTDDGVGGADELADMELDTPGFGTGADATENARARKINGDESIIVRSRIGTAKFEYTTSGNVTTSDK